MEVLWFVVVVMFTFRNLLCAQDVPIKNSAWSVNQQYSNRIELPALFDMEGHSALACTVECAKITGCDVVSYSSSLKQCRGYVSVLTTPTTTPTTAVVPFATSEPSTNGTRVLKRVCAGRNYTFVADLNWCVRFVLAPQEDWSGAQLACQESGGKLAVLDTFDKYSYIYDNFYEYYYTERLWVGGTWGNGSWHYTTGEGLNQTQNYWHQVFNDSEDDASCLSFFNFVFYSGVCGNFYSFFCEEIW
ncbi:uncharacterized protein LOC110450947 [Mizuhopecten yessoensis]|uniref:uncharacterized protein LOC110450947 n=1 Tax=Mizuhopecten yessoensis TaxID=6573 RepID=UPI000B45ABE0|nr:uncharacterized protein LOC110450947 [Mizuhopecten yessoensis]